MSEETLFSQSEIFNVIGDKAGGNKASGVNSREYDSERERA